MNNNSVSCTPSERVIQLDETVHSVNSSALEVSGLSELLPENIGLSLNESLFNAALSGEEVRISTPKRKCVNQKLDYREDGDECCDVDSDDDQLYVPVESTPVAPKRARYQSQAPLKKRVVENLVLQISIINLLKV